MLDGAYAADDRAARSIGDIGGYRVENVFAVLEPNSIRTRENSNRNWFA